MSEIARLRSEIQSRKFRAMELSTSIERKIREIKELLAGASLRPIRELQISLVAELAQEAAERQQEYLQLLEEIERGEKELS